MRLRRLLVVLMIAAAVGGCAHAPGTVAAPDPVVVPPDIDSVVYGRGPVAAPSSVGLRGGGAVVVPVPAVLPVAVPGGDEPYTLDSGDKLRIVVFGQDGLTNTYIVDAAGRITMPLIGPVALRGCTTTQAARLISDKLRNGYIREPHVAIEVETYRPFFILGEVTYPGQYPYVPNMTVETAVAIAGGFTPRAYRYNVDVSRSKAGLTERRNVPRIAPIRPGDTITVNERWF
jgi:polysaccharide export outer membrane protein